MKLSGLLTRAKETLPGTSGVARVDRRTRELLRRVGSGDVVVMDEVDIDRATADVLVAAEVAAVVNAAPSISGRFPNLGPEILVEAGIPLIDNVGADVVQRIKDGSKVRLHEGTLYSGDEAVASGTVQTAESVADAMIEAKAGMSTQLEAFSANTIEFLRRERALILDGVGVPELRVQLKDRHVLVVAPGNEHAEDLKALKKYINEHRPALIGVDAAADTLRELGYTPDVVVGDPSGIGAQTLKECHEVVVPAQPDGYAPGVERIQDLGIGAVTFPASGNSEDLALLLADTHEAGLVVTIGFQATLREFLDHGRSGSNPSTFLTRLKLGTKLVDGKAVATLHRNRVSMSAVVLLVLAALAVVAAALLVSDVGSVYADWLRDTWNSFASWVRGLLS
ncbi:MULTISPECIES: putative cytokinetic ring protein SteA [Prauserella salsuginis group]|uniref:Cytokinetic ring protein SteA n=2 Tax=Prauserella salsuginis group TaxID=2893672 RepID=A0ABW6GA11_9PSEU|nr:MULTISPECIES: putative cytokinetic ring protein SteA [Prauserella salsuginis group]MBB3665335.1 putative membrane-anchored protein [Prauserella sediminis]